LRAPLAVISGRIHKRKGSKSRFFTLHLPKMRSGKAKKVDKSVKNQANKEFRTGKVEFV
jgi:hypothetical protein